MRPLGPLKLPPAGSQVVRAGSVVRGQVVSGRVVSTVEEEEGGRGGGGGRGNDLSSVSGQSVS